MDKKWGTIMALISGTAYGIVPVLSKFAYQNGINVISVLLLRFLGVFLIIWLYQKIYWSDRKLPCLTVVKLISLGALVYAGQSGLYMLSFTTIPVSLACILLYLYPTFVTICAAILSIEKLTRQKAMALILATTGLVLLLRVSFAGVNLIGIIYGIGAAVLYATYIIIGTNIIKGVEPIIALMYIMMGTSIAYGLVGLASGEVFLKLSLSNWILMASMVFFMVTALIFLWLSVKVVGPVKASIISTVEAPVTMFLSAIVFRERITVVQLLGSFMVITAVILLQYSSEEKVNMDTEITLKKNRRSSGI